MSRGARTCLHGPARCFGGIGPTKMRGKGLMGGGARVTRMYLSGVRMCNPSVAAWGDPPMRGALPSLPGLECAWGAAFGCRSLELGRDGVRPCDAYGSDLRGRSSVFPARCLFATRSGRKGETFSIGLFAQARGGRKEHRPNRSSAPTLVKVEVDHRHLERSPSATPRTRSKQAPEAYARLGRDGRCGHSCSHLFFVARVCADAAPWVALSHGSLRARSFVAGCAAPHGPHIGNVWGASSRSETMGRSRRGGGRMIGLTGGSESFAGTSVPLAPQAVGSDWCRFRPGRVAPVAPMAVELSALRCHPPSQMLGELFRGLLCRMGRRRIGREPKVPPAAARFVRSARFLEHVALREP